MFKVALFNKMDQLLTMCDVKKRLLVVMTL